MAGRLELGAGSWEPGAEIPPLKGAAERSEAGDVKSQK